ncbi:phage gp6-like head-tail connector protein [Streptomyces sp. NBC_01237]|uniref:phage gp6-like head-tail connector protein n=1 Tax=Streptomyces sp. NBC_01237 TaxID=2903790 RepID=UPI002DDA72CE|nr:phage gp6-like head-tail connector protein [Streptomyces sp. NBC_01237]WRZ72886.1 phage gp6-like head-tail connector protein [Streptomyces sp. NBC_01237]
MAEDYASIATLRLMLKTQDSDPRDDLLQRALASASRSIDKSTGRRFWLDPVPVARTYRTAGRTVPEDDGEVLLVDDIGSTDGLVVEVGSGTSWSPLAAGRVETIPENALLDGRPVTGLLLVGDCWTSRQARVTTRFGWPAIPDDIEQATLIQANRLQRRKDSPEGVTGSAEWGVVRLSRRDPDVWNLIEQYVLPGFG